MFDNLKKMNLGSIAGLLLILVILPLGALYYMNQGAKWRKERLEELKDYSQLSEQQLRMAYDTLTDIFTDEKNIIVTSFINPEQSEFHADFGANLQRLHEQFDARGDVYFFTHVLNDDQGTFSQAFREKYGLEDEAQCFFIKGKDELMESLATKAYQIERQEGESWKNSSHFALVDNMMVRNYYNVQNPEAVKRLVEHIAILIPPRKDREELVFKREVEK